MSWTFFCHNVDSGRCVWVPPSVGVTAELIYDETTGNVIGAPAGNRDAGQLGTLASDGAGRIIVNTTGRKIIESFDYGETWTEYATALPISNSTPSDPNKFMRPSKWQFVNGEARAFLFENDPNDANQNSYPATYLNGVFTVGDYNDDRGTPPTYPKVGNRNGRYTSGGGAYWEGNTLVTCGRWGSDSAYPGTNIGGTFGNYAAIAKYTSKYGANTVPSSYLNIADNSNSGLLVPVTDGYLLYLATSVNNFLWVPTDLSTYENNGVNNAVGDGHASWNSIDTVIIGSSPTVGKRWFRGAGATLPSFNPNTGGGTRYSITAWGGHTWLYGSSGVTSVYTSYCTTQDGSDATWTRGPVVTLPATISSAGSNGQKQNIFYAGDGWWVGYYINSSRVMLDIYRFRYGTLTGSCA